MFATHQKTSSGQRKFGPQPIVNYSNVEPLNKSVPLAEVSPFKDKFRFYCFYCNHLSYSKSELNHHMVQKHSFPFKCQFCNFGSLTRDHVFRHMREMHAPSTAERPMNLMRKHPTVSNALPGPASTPTTSSVSQFAQITSCSETIRKKVDKDGHRGETVKSNILPKDGTELFAPLNEQIENNKPLTIALPKEVTIPAGCFVELIEVNTVNGKKELKLRLVSQQPTGSPVKDCRDTTSQKATAVAAAASSTTSPTRGNDRTCTANRMTLKRKNCNQHVPKNSTDLRNHFTHFQTTAKDQPRECNSKGSAIRPEIKNKEAKGERCVSQSKTQHLSSPPATGVAVTENIQGAHSSVDFKPETNAEPSHLNFPADQVSTKQLNVEERSPLSDSSTWIQTGGWAEKSFEGVTSGPEALPVISCVFSLSRQWEYLQGCPPPLLRALRRMATGDSTPPVKTSLIYDKQTLALATSQENNIEAGNANNKVDGKDLSPVHEQRITPKTGHQQAETKETEEHSQQIQTQTLNLLYIKEENRRVGINSVEESTQDQCLSPSMVNSTAPARTESLSMSVQNEAPPSGTSHIDPSVAGGISGSVPQGKTNKQDICPRLSSYLTIPLKRIKLENNKLEDDKAPPPSNEKQHVTLNLRRGKKRKQWKMQRSCSLEHSSGNFVGLKADQHVKQPGPNQPVVVLNLAKPQTLRRKVEADSINDTVESDVIPTCHILKMKLNKVMGQKYEVSGCTVRLCLKEA